MPYLNVICEGDGVWNDLKDKEYIDLMGESAPTIHMALLQHGMASGAASVAFRLELPDGTVVITETSLKLLDQAVAIFHSYLEGKAGRN